MKSNIRTIEHKCRQVIKLRRRGFSINKIIGLVDASPLYIRQICYEDDMRKILLTGIRLGYKNSPYYFNEFEYCPVLSYEFEDLSIQEKTIYDKIK